MTGESAGDGRVGFGKVNDGDGKFDEGWLGFGEHICHCIPAVGNGWRSFRLAWYSTLVPLTLCGNA